MLVFIVGDSGPEHNCIRSINKTYTGALMEWNKLRLDLLQSAQDGLNYCKINGDTWGIEMYETMIFNLSNDDPLTMDNYPQETPYIEERELEE